ncbi:MAG: transporter substrate-binding domain-containing protein [Ruminococcus sp.]|jgi:putative glutamine transport system substrate-binding protein
MNLRKKTCKMIPFFLLGAVLLTGGCAASESKSGTLTVGVRDDIMNFSYLNENTGKYYGLEIDIAYELADRLGYRNVEFVTVTPDNRKDTLLNGDVDCLIATYSIAESREENFDFSEPYYTDDTVIMVEKSTLFETIEDLQDKTIGIVSGSNAGPLLANKLYELGMITDKVISNTDTETLYEGASVTKVPAYRELSVLLEEGQVDAVCMDACIAGTYMNEDREFLDVSIAKQEYGVATQKDSQLSQPVADAIQAMLDDGTIEQYIDKWD